MKRRRHLYPGTEEAEQEKIRAARRPSLDDGEPDWLPSRKPNYEKFEKAGWDIEKILVHLNID